MSLLELIVASTMLVMVLTSVGVVLRTGRQAWEAHVADYTRIEAAHATLRHIVRQIRQADKVTAISAAGDNSGRLSLQMQDGSTIVWDHDETTNRITYGVTNPTNLLTPDIIGLRFIGLQADATTATTDVSLIRAVRVDATIQLPVETGATRVLSSWAWIRSW